MSDFINTIEALGDEVVFKQLIERNISELSDNVITKLPDNILREATYLKSVDFPNVTMGGARAFYSCLNLKTVKIPKCTSLGNYMFAQCSKLTSVTTTKVSTVGDYAFQNCIALTAADFPIANSIGESAFYNCKALASVNLPNVTTLGYGAFYACTNLAAADFPALSTVNGSIFSGCTNLSTLILRRTAGVITGKSYMLNNTKIASGLGYIYVPSALLSKYKSSVNWNTYSKQFRALEDWTVDGTVTGDLDIDNRCMVRFFNDDGTLLSYKVVAKGSDVAYDGTPVKPGVDNPSDYEFISFKPVPTNVTANVDCYATYKNNTKINTATWAEINEICEAGNAADYFRVGDTKTEGNRVYRIIGINHDNKADGSGKAGITLAVTKADYETVYMSKYYNSTSTTNWPYSMVYTYLRGTFYNALPAELREVIKTVKKQTTNVSTSNTGSIVDSEETVFIPSYTELCGSALFSCSDGTIYEGFNNTSKRLIYKNGTAQDWWIRNMYSARAMIVTKNGSVGTTMAMHLVPPNNECAVYPCFCI